MIIETAGENVSAIGLCVDGPMRVCVHGHGQLQMSLCKWMACFQRGLKLRGKEKHSETLSSVFNSFHCFSLAYILSKKSENSETYSSQVLRA